MVTKWQNGASVDLTNLWEMLWASVGTADMAQKNINVDDARYMASLTAGVLQWTSSQEPLGDLVYRSISSKMYLTQR